MALQNAQTKQIIIQSNEKIDRLNKQNANAQIIANQTNAKLNKIEDTLDQSKESLASVSVENNKLKFKAMLDEKYEFARKQFSTDEAEVYKQGNKLLIRLKGLSFVTSQSTISPNNYSLLQKVQNVIKDFGSSNVLVEGHSDHTGTKQINMLISSKRAQAVASYFVANSVIEKSNIVSEGYADSKPIATNKTDDGRAKNRRVDVIITPLKAEEAF